MLRYIRKKTRAERKSRREKIRRIHVNNLLETLATTLELDNENRDMASVLTNAIEYVNRTKDEIRVLKTYQESKFNQQNPKLVDGIKSDSMILSQDLRLL